MGFHRMGGGFRIITPHFRQQFGLADDLVAGLVQIFQNCRFPLGQLDRLPAVGIADFPSGNIEPAAAQRQFAALLIKKKIEQAICLFQ